MDWKSYRSSKTRKQGLKNGTHIISLYRRNGKLHLDGESSPKDAILALGEALTYVSGCKVQLIPPKPKGLLTGIGWMLRWKRISQ